MIRLLTYGCAFILCTALQLNLVNAASDWSGSIVPGQGTCYLEVDGKVLVHGVCKLNANDGEVIFDDRERSGYYIAVGANEEGEIAYWNGTPGASLENLQDLGIVLMPDNKQNCWVNERLKVCGTSTSAGNTAGSDTPDTDQSNSSSMRTVSSESPLSCKVAGDKAKIICSVTTDEAQVKGIRLNRGNCAYPLMDDVAESLRNKKKVQEKLIQSDKAVFGLFLIEGHIAQCAAGDQGSCEMIKMSQQEAIKFFSLYDFRGTYKFGDQFEIAVINCSNLLEFTIYVDEMAWTWKVN